LEKDDSHNHGHEDKDKHLTETYQSPNTNMIAAVMHTVLSI